MNQLPTIKHQTLKAICIGLFITVVCSSLSTILLKELFIILNVTSRGTMLFVDLMLSCSWVYLGGLIASKHISDKVISFSLLLGTLTVLLLILLDFNIGFLRWQKFSNDFALYLNYYIKNFFNPAWYYGIALGSIIPLVYLGVISRRRLK